MIGAIRPDLRLNSIFVSLTLGSDTNSEDFCTNVRVTGSEGILLPVMGGGDSEKEDESDQDCFELPIWHSYSSTNTSASKSDNKRGGPREEEQVFLDDLARLQRQEKEANKGAASSQEEFLNKKLRTCGTNLVSTDTTNSQEDDSEIPPLEDIHQDATDGIFTHSSYDDEGAEADFTNLETGLSHKMKMVYVSQPQVSSVLSIPENSYKVVKACRVTIQAPRACQDKMISFSSSLVMISSLGHTMKSWCDEFEALMKSRFLMSSWDELTFLSWPTSQRETIDFQYTIETQKPLGKVEEASFMSLQDSHLSAVKEFLGIHNRRLSNFLAGESLLGNGKSNQLWPLLLQEAEKSWLLFKSKKTLVKHYEDMRICRPSKEYLQVMLVNALRRFRESLRRVTDGTEASCLTYIVLLFLDKLDTDLAQSKVTPLFDTMLVQPTQDEGASSERLFDEQPSPSPAPTSEVPNESLPDSSSAQPSEVPFEQQPDPSPSPFPRLLPKSSPTPIVLDSIPETTGENLGDYSSNDTSLSAELGCISEECLLHQRFQGRASQRNVHKGYVSKQGRKNAKEDGNAKENAQSEGRTREMVDEDKEIDEVRLSTEDVVSTVKEGVSTDFEKVSTDFEKVSTDRPIVSTDESKVSTDEQVESTDESKVSTDEQVEGWKLHTQDLLKHPLKTPTSMTFGDDETIATLLLNTSKAKAASKEKEKGVELKDVEEIDKPRPTSTRSLLTLKPLPKIDPKDKGKKKIEEEDESEIQEEWEAEEVRNKIAEEEATNEDLIKNFDDINARIEADIILVEKLQEQEREQFTIKERAKFLHDTIAAQRKFLARQRSEAIRNRPPTKNQLRNQMMTYLKHIKRSDEDFIAIGSVEDDRMITKMNKKDSSKGEEIKQESKKEVKEEDKGEEDTRKRKHGTRKKMKPIKRRFKQDTSQDDPSD
ncbi:hypothetical protein Tco_1499373 [Tanacetum coccineum]